MASTNDSIKPVTASDLVNAAEQIPLEVEELRKKIPATFDETNALIPARRNKYLMWTHDLVHVMWGVYSGGHFVGTDNLGKHAWGSTVMDTLRASTTGTSSGASSATRSGRPRVYSACVPAMADTH